MSMNQDSGLQANPIAHNNKNMPRIPHVWIETLHKHDVLCLLWAINAMKWVRGMSHYHNQLHPWGEVLKKCLKMSPSVKTLSECPTSSSKRLKVWCDTLYLVLGLQVLVQARPCHPENDHHLLDSKFSHVHQMVLKPALGHAGSTVYIIKNLQHQAKGA